jgi:very-short-patch-repair endonuclease
VSDLEDLLLWQMRAAGLPEPVREFRFAHPRRWRFDLCYPGVLLAVEVEGGVWNRGRHTRGLGFIRDCEKYNAAALDGWRVLRFTAEQIEDGSAVATIRAALGEE